MAKIIIDSDSKSLDQHFAVIHTKRKNRERFPEGCVEIFTSEKAARAAEDVERNRHACFIYGPSVSSESQRIYYLIRWLS